MLPHLLLKLSYHRQVSCIGTFYQISLTRIHQEPGLIKVIGTVTGTYQSLIIYHGTNLVFRSTRAELQRLWSSTSHQLQRFRDNPSCADDEYDAITNDSDAGLSYNLTFDPAEDILPLKAKLTSRLPLTKPRVAILRENGSNGHQEMAFAMKSANFIAIDVHMSDLIAGRALLSSFTGLALCGGFSYGETEIFT